jgi:2-dehydro-3-deoxyphosphogluconate aldolase/(4S)-4-hydroxy-2-oxoglutarate aldolase
MSASKEQVVKSVFEGRVVALARNFPPDVCLKLAEAYVAGGIRFVEITFNQKAPETWKGTAEAIRAIRERFGSDVLAGAGTVLTEEQLTMCIDAGGEFMFSPNTNVALIRSCVRQGLVAMPGALTPSEAVEAWDAGASFVKIFPASVMGPGYIKAIKAPLSHIPLIATGGISPENVADFMRAGCAGVGAGGNLANKEWIASGEWGKITDVARRLVENSRV